MHTAKIALVVLVVGSILSGGSANAQPSAGADQKKSRIALAQEFIREMEALYDLQEAAKKEFAEDPSSNGKLMTSVRVGTRILFEMNNSTDRLAMIPVTGKWAQFRDLLKQADQQRAALIQEMVDGSKALLRGPGPGVNYGALMARAPEATAQVEVLDQTMFQMAQPIFFALVDESRQEADGKLHHLILTKTERTRMVQSIEESFGPILENPKSSSIVTAAWAVKYGLTRPTYKAADER